MEELNMEKFNPQKAELLEIAGNYKNLQINGIEDSAGYLAVNDARKDLKKKRCNITNTGKELRADANKFLKDVLAVEKELVSIIEPTENVLKEKQESIDNEKLIIKRKEFLPERIARLKSINTEIDEQFLLSFDGLKFEEFFNAKNAEFLAEQARKIQEEKDKIEAEKQKLAREKEIEEAKKQAEKEAIELAEKRRLEALAQSEQDKKDAIELAEKQKQEAIDIEHKRAEEEKRKIIEDQERKEAARIQEEKSKKVAIELAEKQRIEEEAKLFRKKAYRTFLDKYEYVEDNDNYKLVNDGNSIILYKKISVFDINSSKEIKGEQDGE